ncbi:MAG: tRNA 2-thiouridine(34) synthase MnmA [Candidatus Nealsonbacteria bacterium]
MKTKSKKRVMVAMSGGLDSSVAAALLKKSGRFEVVGVFMKFWSEEKGPKAENRCCSSESESRARQVAARLSIPFYVLDFKREFKKRVVEVFLKDHQMGLTPNPCVLCNKEIKFGLLLEKGLKMKADILATGHYARIKKTNKGHVIQKAKDKEKDQSYFLWRLSQNQLEHVVFPVGNYKKSQIRLMAKRLKLPVTDIPESQEICFIPKDVNSFLKRHLKVKPGKIVDKDKKTLTLHSGLFFYTIGQRKGLGLPGGPFYVMDKDLRKNLLVVTKNKKDLLKKEVLLRDVNWMIKGKPRGSLSVKVRYRTKGALADFKTFGKNKVKLYFKTGQQAVCPGQSAVLYKGEDLVAGGIIC